MKPNADKCHLLLNPHESNVPKIGNFKIKNQFLKNCWVSILIQHWNRRHLWDSITQTKCPCKTDAVYGFFYMLLIDAFFKSQFNYCDLDVL